MDTLDEKQETRLLHITDGGSQIVLEDESRWKVAPYFKIEVFENWMSGDMVAVRAVSDDPNYPSTIFNTEGGSEVAAKRIN